MTALLALLVLLVLLLLRRRRFDMIHVFLGAFLCEGPLVRCLPAIKVHSTSWARMVDVCRFSVPVRRKMSRVMRRICAFPRPEDGRALGSSC